MRTHDSINSLSFENYSIIQVQDMKDFFSILSPKFINNYPKTKISNFDFINWNKNIFKCYISMKNSILYIKTNAFHNLGEIMRNQQNFYDMKREQHEFIDSYSTIHSL
jgi:hypothetical protein